MLCSLTSLIWQLKIQKFFWIKFFFSGSEYRFFSEAYPISILPFSQHWCSSIDRSINQSHLKNCLNRRKLILFFLSGTFAAACNTGSSYWHLTVREFFSYLVLYGLPRLSRDGSDLYVLSSRLDTRVVQPYFRLYIWSKQGRTRIIRCSPATTVFVVQVFFVIQLLNCWFFIRLMIRMDNSGHSGQLPLSLELTPVRLACHQPLPDTLYSRIGNTVAQPILAFWRCIIGWQLLWGMH